MRTFIFCFCCNAALLSSALAASDCPVPLGQAQYSAEVAAAIKATPTCNAATELAESCALGATADTQIALVAERQCGLAFWTKLSGSEKKHYNQLQAKCAQKYAQHQGTMYQSAAAFCRLAVARLYAELYTPAE